MRKFSERASVVVAVWVFVGCGIPAQLLAKESSGSELDPAVTWHIAKRESRWVAVAKRKNSGLSAVSTNGMDWQVERLIVGLNMVAQSEERFVAVGESGAVAISTNGAHWQITSISTNELCAVAYVGGCFLASGCAPVREFFTSQAGVGWRRHEVAGEGAEARIAKILETWVTGATNRAAERELTSIANEVRRLCRTAVSGK